MPRSFISLGLAAAIAAASLGGCAADDVEQTEQNQIGLEDLYQDGKNLDLSDLLSVGAGFATDELNDLLNVTPFVQIELEPTELYASSSAASGDLTLNDLDELVSGLATRFGERELTTEVNRARQAHLATSSDEVFAESAFEISAGLHNWSHGTEGFGDATVRLGFDANERVEARIVAAYGSEAGALAQAPLSALSAARGYVLPRSVEDLTAMSPGESYALAGRGRLGVNIGVGVPILTTGLDALTYNLVFSAGVRALLEGRLDVQVVRLDGDQLVVDVGMSRAKTNEFRVAIHDGWGIAGLVESHVQIGPIDLDLGRLAERALEKQLNRKLNLFEAAYEKTNLESRLSISRFRYDLARVTDGSPAETSLAQLLHGDLRLAQALANREEPGVTAEFELSRSGASSTSYAGIDILGMRFFRKVQEQNGTIVVQTPGGAQAINFDSLHYDGGIFSSHGYNRIGLAGLDFADGDVQGETNLILQVRESASNMRRDRLIDHLDGVIIGLGGPYAFMAVEAPANAMTRYVQEACPQAEHSCKVAVVSDPFVTGKRQEALDAIEAKLGHLGESQKAIVMKAAEMRLSAQAVYEDDELWDHPSTSVVADYRLDAAGLDALLQADHAQFDLAMDLVIRTMHVDRADDMQTIAEDANSKSLKTADLRQDAWALFHDTATRFDAAREQEGLVLPAHPELGAMGESAIEIRYAVDHDNTVRYEDAVARSLPEARAKVVSTMVDEMIELIDDRWFIDHGEQVVAYTLLGLTPGPQIDLRLNVDFDMSSHFMMEPFEAAGYESFDVYARGAGVSRIDGGLFNIDQLIDLD